jgi:hypothetical protein
MAPADAAKVVLRCPLRHGGWKRQRRTPFGADAQSAGMVDAKDQPAAVGGLGCGGQRLHGSGDPDRRRSGVGDLTQAATMDPPRNDEAEATGVQHVEHRCNAWHMDSSQPNGVRQNLIDTFGGHRTIGVDEGQCDFSTQRGVHPAPKLQMAGPTVRILQSVASVDETGAWDEGNAVGHMARRCRFIGHRHGMRRPFVTDDITGDGCA